nr:MAG TPA: hypothetical protein [Bacteriophage sp.]
MCVQLQMSLKEESISGLPSCKSRAELLAPRSFCLGVMNLYQELDKCYQKF